jgi:hypothetical protein
MRLVLEVLHRMTVRQDDRNLVQTKYILGARRAHQDYRSRYLRMAGVEDVAAHSGAYSNATQ